MLTDYAQRTLDMLWRMPANAVVYFDKDVNTVYTAREMHNEIMAETPLAQGFLNRWLEQELI